MATRSLIGYANPNGTINYVYCHNDGCLSHNGRILLNFYNTFERVKQLVNEGDISFLDEEQDAPAGHSFQTPVPGHTVYYGRDRGEQNVGAKMAYNRAEYSLIEMPFIKYLFKEDKWFYRHSSEPGPFSELTPEDVQ